MNPRRAVLTLVLATLFAATVYACGGKIDPDATSFDSSRSQGDGDEDRKKDDSVDPSGTAKKRPSDVPTSSPPAPPSPPTPAQQCQLYGGSSSGGGDGPSFSCESVSYYECGARKAELSCKCVSVNGVWTKGACSCDGESFEYDCARGCSPSAEVYAKCNLPLPDTGSSGGSSSTSSGG